MNMLNELNGITGIGQPEYQSFGCIDTMITGAELKQLINKNNPPSPSNLR